MGRRSRGGALAVLVLLLAQVITLAAAPEEVQSDPAGARETRWEDGRDDAKSDDARRFSPVDPRRIACMDADVDEADATRYLASLEFDIGDLDPPFHPLTREYTLSIPRDARAPRSAPGDANVVSPHAPAAMLGVRALPCDPEADVAVGNARTRREVTYRPRPGGAFDVLQRPTPSATGVVAKGLGVAAAKVPLAKGGNVVRVAVHVGHDDEDAEIDARTVYTIRAVVEDESRDETRELRELRESDSVNQTELASARSAATEAAVEAAGWTPATRTPNPALAQPGVGDRRAVAIGSTVTRVDVYPGSTTSIDAPGPAFIGGVEADTEWTLEIIAVPRGGTTRLVRVGDDGEGAKILGPIAVRIPVSRSSARFSFRLHPGSTFNPGSSLSLLYRACVGVSCGDEAPRRIALDVVRATPPAPPALHARTHRESPRPFTIPRPFDSKTVKRHLEITSLPAKGTLVLCGVENGEDGEMQSGTDASLSFAVIDRPIVVSGDESGTPARVVYVPHGPNRYSLETRATVACENRHGPAHAPVPAGPRARKARARRALLGEARIDKFAKEDAVESPSGRSTTDGFTYRFVSNGLPSPSAPVTVHVDDGDAYASHDDDTPSIGSRRRLLSEQIAASASVSASVDDVAAATVPAASAGGPVCVEVAVADAVDDWTCAPSVQPGDRKRGHHGPITCRKPAYEVEIAVAGGGEVPSPGCVVVGATYDTSDTCPVDGIGDDRYERSSRRSASVPATLLGLSACAADATLTVWARSTCDTSVQLTVSVKRTLPSADTGMYPRKKLADCLDVPPATVYVCPEDLTEDPRPASCPPSWSSGAGDVLVHLPASVAAVPTGVDVPSSLTVRWDVFTAPHPDNAAVYQYDASDGTRGAPFLSIGDQLPIEVVDPNGRVVVTPTPRGGSAGNRAWPGSPAVTLRYVACVVEDGTCANSGVAEIDVSARPTVFAEQTLLTTKGAVSAAYRLDARDSDGDQLLYVITDLPEELLDKGTTRYCAEGDPDTLTCVGSTYTVSNYCAGRCLILCSAGASCVECTSASDMKCSGSQVPARNPLLYFTGGTCPTCGGRPLGTIGFKAYDGAQFSSPVAEPGVGIDVHVNHLPVATTPADIVGLLDRVPADCDGECVADCAAACARSCAEYRETRPGVSIGECETNNLSGECDAAACGAACTKARCEGRYGITYTLAGTDEDDDVLSFKVISVPFYVRDNGDG